MFDREVLRAYYMDERRDFHNENFLRGYDRRSVEDIHIMRMLKGKISEKSVRKTDHSSRGCDLPRNLLGAVNLLLDIDGFGSSVKAASANLLDGALVSQDIYNQRPDVSDDRHWIVWALSAAMLMHLGMRTTFRYLGPDSSFTCTVTDPVNWAIFTALYIGELATVRRLLDLTPHREHSSEKWNNLLQMAARTGSEEALLLLLERGADVNSVGDGRSTEDMPYHVSSYGTTLEVACLVGHKHILDILFDPKYRLKTSGWAYMAAVCDASGREPTQDRPPTTMYGHKPHMDILRLVLDRGEFIHYFTQVKHRMLQDACMYGQAEMVRFWLEVGVHHVDPNYESLGCVYRLCGTGYCTEEECVAVLRILLDFDVKQRDCENSVFHCLQEPFLQAQKAHVQCDAVEKGNLEIIRLLYDYGALSYRGRDRIPGSFTHAAESGQLHIMKFYMSTGLDLHAKQSSIEVPKTGCGIEALEKAASEGHEDIVQYLLELGVNTLELPFNEQPVRFATANGHHAVVRKLEERGDLTHATSG